MNDHNTTIKKIYLYIFKKQLIRHKIYAQFKNYELGSVSIFNVLLNIIIYAMLLDGIKSLSLSMSEHASKD